MSYKIIRLLGINSNNVAIDSFCSDLCVWRERERERGREKEEQRKLPQVRKLKV
jgi:hypothetical protein